MRQKMLNAISRHTHSMTWNIHRHRLRQELKRALRRWQSRTVSGGGLCADAGRDCTISTPTMNDTRIKWNTFTLKKKVMVTQFPPETERHCEAKKKKKAIYTSHSIVCGFHRERAWTQCSNMRRSGEPLVASSAINLLGDSRYLRWDLNETNGGTVLW